MDVPARRAAARRDPAVRAGGGDPAAAVGDVDPQAAALIERVARANRPPFPTLTPEEARREHDRVRVLDIAGRPVAEVAEVRVAGGDGEIGARLYRSAAHQQDAPLLVFCHGGGFVVGSVDLYDPLCRTLALDARCSVLSLDYRLAPEHPFPAAAEDVLAACRWVFDRAASLACDPRRIAIGGDSAGGTLAAQACVRLRDQGLAPCAQLLVYPGTESGRVTQSHRQFERGFLRDGPTIDWFFAQYLRDPADALDPRFAPARTSDLSRLPPTLIVLAGCDALRDEGAAYGQRLRDAGVAVEVRTFDGMVHGFLNMGAVLDQARVAHAAIAAWLRERFGLT